MNKDKILIIDDDQDFIESTKTILEDNGFKVYSVDEVEEGINLIQQVEPDIILLDIMFPEKKTLGFEATNTIKNKYPQIPIITMSSINKEYAFNFSKEDTKTEEFLTKPIKVKRLLETVKKYINQNGD